MPLLHPGDAFPELTLAIPGGKTVTVPETFAGQFGVVLFYQGASPCRSMTKPAPPTSAPSTA